MVRATLKSLLAHRLRLILTALSVVLGVGFVTGTLVLTDTMSRTFNDLVTTTTAGIDVSVSRDQPFGNRTASTTGPATEQPLLDADDIVAIEAVDGVAAVEPDIQGWAQLLDVEGQPIGGNGPPTLGVAAPIHPEVTTTTIRDGRYPASAGEVAIDAATARAQSFDVGDEVIVVVPSGPPVSAEVVGILGFGEADNIAGATLTMLDVETARALYSPDETYPNAYVVAGEGVGRTELRDRISAALGDGYTVQTGEQLAAATTADISQVLGFFNTALLVFAGVSLLVAAFIITNTFSIIVAQRTRELALLRAIGASSGQVLRSVLLEAVATGLFASLVGLVLGLGVASGLRALMQAFGFDLPGGDLVFATRTIVAALVVGVGVTSLAALGPALKANRVPPVAALQSVAAPPIRQGRGRTTLGAVLSVAGVAGLAAGLFAGSGNITAVGAGAAVTLIGASLLSPLVTRPLVRLLGFPVQRLGIRGELARENALRNPRRTAATASALMIGLGLVSFVMILGASINASATATIERTFRSELRVQPTQQTQPMPGGVADALRDADGVAAVLPLQLTQFRYDGKLLLAFGVVPDALEPTLDLEVLEGDLAAVANGGLVVADDIAEHEGWTVGEAVPMEFALTGIQQVPLRAIVDGDSLADIDFMIDDATFGANSTTTELVAAFVKLDDGVTVADGHAAVERSLADYPTVEVLDVDEQKAAIQSQVNQLLGLLTGLLALSIVIALFGIVNTLSLSVFERMRELALLRAVGMSRGQMRAMVRWESVLIAALGATFGLVIGTLFGWLLVEALSGLGINTLSMPWLRLFVGVFAAAVAGVIAAIGPARRASRVDMLRALQTE